MFAHKSLLAIIAATTALFAFPALGIEQAVPMGSAPRPAAPPRAPVKNDQEPTEGQTAPPDKPAAKTYDWADFGFAVGLGYAHLREENIKSASVHGTGDAAVLRVDDSNNGVIGVWLELHNWMWSSRDGTRGFGPFVGIQAASNSGNGDTISSYAIGVMYGTKRGSAKPGTKAVTYESFNYLDDNKKLKLDPKTGEPLVATVPKEETQVTSAPSMNIALGVASINVQTLGDGLTAGAPLPPGVTEVYYKKKRMYVPMLMVSFGF